MDTMIRSHRDYIGSQVERIHQDRLEEKIGCMLSLIQKMSKKVSVLYR